MRNIMTYSNGLRPVLLISGVLLQVTLFGQACSGVGKQSLTFDQVVQATVAAMLTPPRAGIDDVSVTKGKLTFDESVRATVSARLTPTAEAAPEATAMPEATLPEEQIHATTVARAVQATVAAMPTPEPVTVEVEKTVLETVIVEKSVEVTVIVTREVTVRPTSAPLTNTPFRAALEAATSTPSPTNTMTARPRGTPTALSVVTPSPTQRTAATAAIQPFPPTATPVRYGAPVVVEPEEGAVFTGREAKIAFSWESVGQLPDGVYYVLHILYPHQGSVWHDEQWTQETAKEVQRYIYDNATLPATMEWYVVVARRTGTSADGRHQGTELSPRSETRMFSWQREGAGPGPGPAPATPTIPPRPE
jgi:hypothetical protein